MRFERIAIYLILIILPLIMLRGISPRIVAESVEDNRSLAIVVQQETPWHGILIESDNIDTKILLKNNSNKSHTVSLTVKAKLLSSSVNDTALKHFGPLTINGFSNQNIDYQYPFYKGLWQLNISALDTVNKAVYPKTHLFVVQSTGDLFQYGAAIGGVVAALVAVTAVIIQVLYNRRTLNEMRSQTSTSFENLETTKEQIRNQDRPWLSSYKQATLEKKDGVIRFFYKNYGKMPAKLLAVGHIVVTPINEIHKEKIIQEIRNRIDADEYDINKDPKTYISPEQVREYVIPGIPGGAINQQFELFFAIVARYQYGLDKGKSETYGIIAQYDAGDNSFVICDEWIEGQVSRK